MSLVEIEHICDHMFCGNDVMYAYVTPLDTAKRRDGKGSKNLISKNRIPKEGKAENVLLKYFAPKQWHLGECLNASIPLVSRAIFNPN